MISALIGLDKALNFKQRGIQNAREDRVAGVAAGEGREGGGGERFVVVEEKREGGGVVVEGAETHTQARGDGTATEDIVGVEEVDSDAAASVDNEERVMIARELARTNGGSDTVHAKSFGGLVIEGYGKAGAIGELMETGRERGGERGTEVGLWADDGGDGGIDMVMAAERGDEVGIESVDSIDA